MTCLIYAGATRCYVLRLATAGLPALGKNPEQTPFSRRALEGGEARSRPRPDPPSAGSPSGPEEAAPRSARQRPGRTHHRQIDVGGIQLQVDLAVDGSLRVLVVVLAHLRGRRGGHGGGGARRGGDAGAAERRSCKGLRLEAAGGGRRGRAPGSVQALLKQETAATLGENVWRRRGQRAALIAGSCVRRALANQRGGPRRPASSCGRVAQTRRARAGRSLCECEATQGALSFCKSGAWQQARCFCGPGRA